MCEYKVVGNTFPVNMMCERTALCNKEPLRPADRRNQVIHLFFSRFVCKLQNKRINVVPGWSWLPVTMFVLMGSLNFYIYIYI